MRQPYWHDPNAKLYAGDARHVLAEMPAGSVDCIVISPPPWTPHEDPLAAQQGAGNYGYEATPALYVAALRRIGAEAHRILADDGTLWLVLSDRYGAQTRWTPPPGGRHARSVIDPTMTGLPASSLIGLPWQVAFALHDDGWIICNAIVWSHGDPEEEFTSDRLPLTYELVFLLTKQKEYHFGIDSIRQLRQHSDTAVGSGTPESAQRRGTRHTGRRGSGRYGNAIGRCRGSNDRAATVPPGNRHAAGPTFGKDPGDVWALPGRSFRNSLPIELPLRCIAAGCRPGGTVLDPFAGIATTGLAARALDRSFIGIEANPARCELAKARLSQAAGGADEEPE